MAGSSLEAEKAAARGAVFLERKALASEEKARWDRLIKERLFSLPELEEPQAVLAYADIRNEAGTGLILEELWKRGIPAAVPRVSGRELEWILIRGAKELTPGYRRIPEPADGMGKRLELSLLKGAGRPVILVPGVAFDPKGRRLGYGGGFYDRFLSRERGLISIGLAYEFQIMETVPAGSHDQCVEQIVTPQRRIICRRDER